MAGDLRGLFPARSCVSGSQRLAQGGRRRSSRVNGTSLCWPPATRWYCSARI